jgi:hypothetical protein
MGKIVKYRKATLQDADLLSRRLREADKRELMAGSEKSPFESLAFGVRNSIESWTAYDEQEPDIPIAMFGCKETDTPGYATIWLLSSDGLFDTLSYVKALIGEAPKFLAAWLYKYDVLFNRVHRENTAHINWLKYLGARFREDEINDPSSVFLLFSFHREDIE